MRRRSATPVPLECGASRTPEPDQRDPNKSDDYKHDHESIRAEGFRRRETRVSADQRSRGRSAGAGDLTEQISSRRIDRLDDRRRAARGERVATLSGGERNLLVSVDVGASDLRTHPKYGATDRKRAVGRVAERIG